MVDPKRVARWTAQIVAGDLAEIEAVFTARTGGRPILLWSPRAADVAAPQLRFLLDYWSSLAPPGRLPSQRQIDPAAMRPALGFVMLLDAVAGGEDFRYRLFGSIIARVSEYDLTGRLLSEQPASPYVVELGLAVSRAALLRRLPLYSERTPAAAERTTRWQRLALPLADETGAVTRLLAGTVPVARDGRVIG